MQESQNPERDKEDDSNIDNVLNIYKFHTQHDGKYKRILISTDVTSETARLLHPQKSL